MMPLHRLLLLAALVAASTSAAAAQTVRVHLKARAAVTAALATIGDVADVASDPPPLAARIAALDLALRSASREGEATVTAEQVRARIALDGIPPTAIAVEGQAATRLVWWSAEQALRQIELAVVRHVSAALNLDAAAIEVRIDPTPRELAALARLPFAEGEVQPLDSGPTLLGRRSAEFAVRAGGELQRLRLTAEVAAYRDVRVTSRPIRRGESLDDSNTYIQRQRFTSAAALASPAEESLAGIAVRDLRAQQTLLRRDVDSGGAATAAAGVSSASEPVLIRPRDRVTVRLRQGGLSVTLSGAEALRGGRRGEWITVRNTNSGKVLTARVVDSQTVEIETPTARPRVAQLPPRSTQETP